MNTIQSNQRQELPDSLAEIADVVGLEGALKLVEQCGGTRIFIPRKVGVQHQLANLLGFEQARRMSQHFGGETISIVRAAAALRKRRNLEIISRYDGGEGVRVLARAYQLTERHIYAILATTG